MVDIVVVVSKLKEPENENRASRFKGLARKVGAAVLVASLSLGAGAAFSSSSLTSTPTNEEAAVQQYCGEHNIVASKAITESSVASTTITSKDNLAMRALQKMYNPDTGLFNGAQWWQQPVILQAIMDYSTLSHNERYMVDVCRTFMLNNSGRFITGQNDDEGWWAQAWIRAYEMTKEARYLNAAKLLFENISESWTSKCGGGVLWNTGGTYKNSITNSQFMGLAASLYGITGEKKYLNWALREYRWFMSTGMLTRSGDVLDGLTQGCKAGGGIWTYNQGELIRALVALSKVTGDQLYTDKAEGIANYTDLHSANASGILIEIGCSHTKRCNIDPSNVSRATRSNDFLVNSSSFNGIYMMDLYGLYRATDNTAYLNFILKNAASIQSGDRGSKNIIGLNWSDPSQYWSVTEASTQASGIAVLNAGL